MTSVSTQTDEATASRVGEAAADQAAWAKDRAFLD
jgi:hypothetical protein